METKTFDNAYIFDEALNLVSSAVYPDLDRSPKANWVEKAGGLPKYIERIAKHLHYEKSMTISRAIATAVSRVKVWCATSKDAKVKEQACKAVAQWEAKKAKSKASTSSADDSLFYIVSFAEGEIVVSDDRKQVSPISDAEYFADIGLEFPSEDELAADAESVSDEELMEVLAKDADGRVPDGDQRHADEQVAPGEDAEGDRRHPGDQDDRAVAEGPGSEPADQDDRTVEPGSPDGAVSDGDQRSGPDTEAIDRDTTTEAHGEPEAGTQATPGEGDGPYPRQGDTESDHGTQAVRSQRPGEDATRGSGHEQLPAHEAVADQREGEAGAVQPADEGLQHRAEGEADPMAGPGTLPADESPAAEVPAGSTAVSTATSFSLAPQADGSTTSSAATTAAISAADQGVSTAGYAEADPKRGSAALGTVITDTENGTSVSTREVRDMAYGNEDVDMMREDYFYQVESLISATRTATRLGDDDTVNTLVDLIKNTLDKCIKAKQDGEMSEEAFLKIMDLAGENISTGDRVTWRGKNVGESNEGTVKSISGKIAEVKTKDGETVKVPLAVLNKHKKQPSEDKDKKDTSLAYQLPIEMAETKQVGKAMWKKHILPFGKINYKGSVLNFSKAFSQKLVENFNKQPFDQVPFFFVNEKNEHNSHPDNVRGEVKGLELGENGVYALFETNEDGTTYLKDKNPNLGTSVRVRFDWTRPSDNKYFGPVLEHLAGTTLPFVPGLGKAQPADMTIVDMSEDEMGGVEDLTSCSLEAAEGGENVPDNDKPENTEEVKTDMSEAKDTAIDLSKIEDPTVRGFIEQMQQQNEDLRTKNDEIKGVADLAMQKFQEGQRKQYEQTVEMKLTKLGEEGVTPAKIKFARPLLLDATASEEVVVDLTVNDEGVKVENKSTRADLVWKLLEESKGELEYGERGHGDLTVDLDELDEDQLYARYKAALGEDE